MKTKLNQLFVVGLNHQSTPIDLREKWSVPPETLESLLGALRSSFGWQEVVVLSTCNRLEIYGVASNSSWELEHLLRVIAQASHSDEAEADLHLAGEYFYNLEGQACVQHLLRVASSLDSLVVGETEIMGQVKQAYQRAHACGATGKILNRLFQTALSVSKQVRTRSGIGRCSTSVGSVALELAEKIFGEDLTQRTILIIGAGKMSETTLRHLAKRGVKAILVANRSVERAQELAAAFAGEAIPLTELSRGLLRADIVVSSTSAPHPLVSRQDLSSLMPLRANRPLLLVDLAVPRDISPEVLEIDGVFLYNIDQLSEIARLNLGRRQTEAALCEGLVSERANKLALRLMPADVAPSAETMSSDLLAQATRFCRVERTIPAF
jgi:glutamyl-tRNA reductase